MAKYIFYRCEDCGETFRHFHQFSDSPPPEECPHCAGHSAEETFVPQAPGIKKSPLTKSMDETYRRMEAASIIRAQEAASLAGVPEAEMSHLKITNMKDPTSVREGEHSAILPPTPVTSAMSSVGGGFNPLSAQGQLITGQQFAVAATHGPGAGSGRHTLDQVVHPHHRQMAVAMQRAGQINR